MNPLAIDTTLTLIHVPALGWMPTLKDANGKETYRGEYRETPHEALARALRALTERETIGLAS